MHIAMCAVVHQLALMQSTAFDEAQSGWLAPVSGNCLMVIFVIVAAIAGPQIAVSQEIEVVIMRGSVGEAMGTAPAETTVPFTWPDVRPQEKPVARSGQHDRLRTVGTVRTVSLACAGQQTDHPVAKKGPVFTQRLEISCNSEDAGFASCIEPAGRNRRSAFVDRHCVTALPELDYPRHNSPSWSASSGCAAHNCSRSAFAGPQSGSS